MKLDRISQINGQIELLSGLHIGSGNTEMHIGGTDNPVIRNPVSAQPYIPGSSIKGKMRSLMEWQAGVVAVANGQPLNIDHLGRLDQERQQGVEILRLFGYAPTGKNQDAALVNEIGPTRLSFWDCDLDSEWVRQMNDRDLLLTEVKMENTIDRIKGTAAHPRNTERVPAGAVFNFRLSLKVIDGEDLIEPVLRGLKLLEYTGLGGSQSRGYGKLAFRNLQIDGEDLQPRFDAMKV